jgi:5-methylcytosine-specific restriction endonuclease McrA
MKLGMFVERYMGGLDGLGKIKALARGFDGRLGPEWLEKNKNQQVNEHQLLAALGWRAADLPKKPVMKAPTNDAAMQRPRARKRRKKGPVAKFSKHEPAFFPCVQSPAPQGEQYRYANSPDFLRSFEWRQLRFQALQKYGRRCQCCGSTPESGAIMHVDHVKSRRSRPELALDINNLQVLCADCNHGKGNLTVDFRNG